MRKLASIQRIISISAIEGADKIELAQVLGWHCVVSKSDNLSTGDLVIYFEIDSILPEKPEFEFLRKRKFRIKTVKFCNQISQGLILPISFFDLKDIKIEEGADLTDFIGVKKYDPEFENEKNESVKKSKSKILNYLMNFGLFRELYTRYTYVPKGWPKGISKTDEERIQNCYNDVFNKIIESESFYDTEKLDGQSATYFLYKKGIFNKLYLGVCSRNIWIKKENDSNWWKIARQYDMLNKLIKISKHFLTEDVVIQGEIVGEGIQKNRYNFKGLKFYIFNIIVNGNRLPFIEFKKICDKFVLDTVPILREWIIFRYHGFTAEDFNDMIIKNSYGKSVLNNVDREGVVTRSCNDNSISFKAINADFLLKE